MRSRLIINGKLSQNIELRKTIEKYKRTHNFDIRVTWEAGDISALTQEVSEDCERIIIAGGDGSVNEAVDGLMKMPKPPELAVVPLGTANDLAISGKVPIEIDEAFKFALEQSAVPIDVIQMNDNYILNAASLGQAAKVTERTPDFLKGVVGKYAYSLSSLISFFDTSAPVPFVDNLENNNEYIFGYICNGQRCGGGFEIAPKSKIDDGLIDVLLIKKFDLTNIANITFDLWQNNENDYIKRMQVKELYLESKSPMPISLDGEIYSSNKIYLKNIFHALKMVIHSESELLVANKAPSDELTANLELLA
ncbi:MAG: YegS/Rv2252/BmrU family lipid kinase [Lentisphaeraceae bacterium]|nr:YegS/Rv2252/BmrU family lipid kinase [Lentisphaeraceae bacterium]